MSSDDSPLPAPLPVPVDPPAVAIAGQRPGWRPRGASLAGLLASAVLLAVLYRSLDFRLIVATLVRADKVWLVVSVFLILPITALRAIRFYWVAPAGALPSLGEALRLTLVSSALNVFIPAKAGDLVKSYFIATRSHTSAGVAVSVVLYERLCDLVGLITWCMLGYAVARPQVPGLPDIFWPLLGLFGCGCLVLIVSNRAATSLLTIATGLLPKRAPRQLRNLASGWPELVATLRGRRVWAVLFSLALWLAHLFQIWLFTVTLSARIPFTVCASLATVALMAGQLPFTLAGLGARDVALVLLLSRYMPRESAAALGILIATRNVLPPLCGLPLIGPYLSTIIDEARRWRSAAGQSA
jgi:glycosyltransferase 2 family protein